MILSFVPDYKLDPPPQMDYPSCPVCGSVWYDYIYKDWNNNVCGCSECVNAVEAEDYADEVDNRERD